jgi:hypothetical protein
MALKKPASRLYQFAFTSLTSSSGGRNVIDWICSTSSYNKRSAIGKNLNESNIPSLQRHYNALEYKKLNLIIIFTTV